MWNKTVLRLVYSRKGSSLVELLAVAGLLTVLTAVVLLQFNLHQGENKLEKSARLLASEIRLIQQKAVSSGITEDVPPRERPYRMEFFTEKDEYALFLDDEEGEESSLPEGISFDRITFPEVEDCRLLSFRHTAAPNSGGTVELVDREGAAKYVIVTPATGRVRVSKDPPRHW